MRVVLLVVALILLAALPVAAATVQSGQFIKDTLTGQITIAQPGTRDWRTNALGNPGFETGALAPWTSNGWFVSEEDPHSGDYHAEATDNVYLRQEFDPIDVGDIFEISMWSKQPAGIAFQAVDFYYGPNDYDEFLVGPGAGYTFLNMTGQLRPAGQLVAIQIWGYWSSDEPPDITRADDVLLDADIITPAQTASWSMVKSRY